MEPILELIAAAAGTFGNEAINETARRSVGQAWDVAKKVIASKFGGGSAASQLMDELQRKPSQAEARRIGSQLAALDEMSDPAVAQAFKALGVAMQSSGSVVLSADTINYVGNLTNNHGVLTQSFRW